MSLPRWDEEMKFELLRLKSELRPENFRVLHQPLGLGTVRADPWAAPPAPLPHLKPTNSGTPAKEKSQALSPPPMTKMPSTLQDAIGPYRPLANAPKSPTARFLRLVIIHALDLAFVCLCLSLGLILLSWVIDPQHVSFNLKALKQASPLQFLQKLQTLALVLGVYTAFVLYWIFFKVVSGTTIGETCFDFLRHPENSGTAAPLNGSGDS